MLMLGVESLKLMDVVLRFDGCIPSGKPTKNYGKSPCYDG